jgi:hypothetical protein
MRDFTDTPIGRIPGGYVVVSAANDFLTDTHITSKELPVWILALLVVFAAFAHSQERASTPIVLGLSAILLWAVFSFGAFAYYGTHYRVLGVSGFLAINMLSGAAASSAFYERLRGLLRLVEAQKALAEHHLREAADMAVVVPSSGSAIIRGFHVSNFQKTFEHATGDWHAIETSPSGRYIHLLIADVTGHGLQAALVVSSCHAVLSVLLSQSNGQILENPDFPAVYAQTLQEALLRSGKGRHTTTLCAASVDVETGSISYCSAAHPPTRIFKLRSKPPMQSLTQRNCHIGFEQDTKFFCSMSRMEPDDVLVLHSDCIPISARSFRSLLDGLDTAEIDATKIVARIMSENGFTQEDDMTLIVAHWRS